MRRIPALVLALVLLCGEGRAQLISWPYEVVESYPQDRGAFTQGLCHDGAALILGTGQYGKSSLRRVDLASGSTLLRRDLDGRIFGEGVAQHGNLIYQLTWKNGLALKYEARTLQPAGALRYRGEGWGLTSNGRDLIMSNGSDVLVGRDPQSFAVRWKLKVTMGGRPLAKLNELEYIKGKIFANVWQSDEIVVIDPQSGEVEAVVDCRSLVNRVRGRHPLAGVLNGIAYDARRDLVLVTGKNWDRIFALRLKRGN